MTTEEPPKEDWLKMLCRQVANTICKADAVSSLEPCCYLEIFCSVWLEVQEAKELVNVLGEIEQKTFVLAYLQVSSKNVEEEAAWKLVSAEANKYLKSRLSPFPHHRLMIYNLNSALQIFSRRSSKSHCLQLAFTVS